MICYDAKYALRLCTEQRLDRACVHIYTVLGLHDEAVDLALKVRGLFGIIGGWCDCWAVVAVVVWLVRLLGGCRSRWVVGAVFRWLSVFRCMVDFC